MLRKTEELIGHTVQTTDGPVGLVSDVYFDDLEWTIRYLIVDTGAWLKHRKVLLAPQSLKQPDWNQKLIVASVSRDDVLRSPDIDTAKPVSRHHETLFLTHYQHPRYWEGARAPALRTTPLNQSPESQIGWSQEQFLRAVAAAGCERIGDSEQHLRSWNAISKYSVRSLNGDVGRVCGALHAETNWALKYLVVQAGHWWHGDQLLAPVQCLSDINWLDSYIAVNMSKDHLMRAPRYNADLPLGEDDEAKVLRYYDAAL